MENQQIKVNQIQKQAGKITFKFGLRMLQDAFKSLNPRQISFGDLKNILTANGLNIKMTNYDIFYYTTTWEQWLALFNEFLLDEVKYYSEKFDCDQHAFLISSLSGLFMLLNSCGVVHCQVYDNVTKKFIAGHFCNIIATSNNEIYLYDLNNNGGWVKYKAGEDNVVNNWLYKDFDYCFFF